MITKAIEMACGSDAEAAELLLQDKLKKAIIARCNVIQLLDIIKYDYTKISDLKNQNAILNENIKEIITGLGFTEAYG